MTELDRLTQHIDCLKQDNAEQRHYLGSAARNWEDAKRFLDADGRIPVRIRQKLNDLLLPYLPELTEGEE